MRTFSKLSVVLTIMAQPLVHAVAEPRVHFREDFRNYRETAPFVAAQRGIQIGNDPIWSQRAEIDCRMTEAGLVFNGYLPADMDDGVRDCDILFQFRFHKSDQPRFDLRLRQQQNGKAGDIIVHFTDRSVRVSSEGLKPAVAAEGQLPSPIAPNTWRQCAITVKGGVMRVLIDDNRVLHAVVETRIASQSAAGINFHGYKDSGFAISDIVIRDPAPLPNHTITRLLPTLALDSTGYTSGAAQPTVEVPANDIFGATFRTGPGADAVKVTLRRDDGSTHDISFAVGPIKRDKEPALPDGVIHVKGIDAGRGKSIDYHVRPMLRRYHTSYSYTDTYHDIIRDWELLPKASEYPVTLEARRSGDGVDIYLNGRFTRHLAGGVKGMTFSLSPTASIGDVVSRKEDVDASRYLPLDIAALRRAKAFADATPSLPVGPTKVNGIPMRVASGADSADIGLTREGQGNWALEVDEYLARSAFDGLLTEVHFSVPSAPYTTAWVLCAVDPDPSKDPILTTRLAHYVENGTGNNTLADTLTVLPRGTEQPGEGIAQVGTVSRPDGKGGATTLPLYLVEVPLRSGQIIDIIAGKSLLNFEFFGKPSINLQQIDNSSKPDPHSTSAVQIFGVTLEKAPVSLALVQSQPANIFHNNDKPQTTVVVHALAQAQGSVAWQILDVDGREVRDGAAPFSLDAAGDQREITIPLDVPQPGWFELNISVRDSDGKTLLTHPARFALLGQDRRRARYDSPYGVWWFDGAHFTPSELAFAGPILLKAGIRKVAWTGQTEEAMRPWFLTKDQVNMPFRFEDLKDPQAAIAKAKVTMDKYLRDYPHLREVLVFHESGPGNDLPVELLGIKPHLSEWRVGHEKRYADLANLAGAFFREHYPQLKLVVGNNSASQSVIAAVLRHGGNPDYIDYIGIEAPSQVFIPEKLQEWALQGHHIASDTARVLSGRHIPATGCYEFTYRCERDMGEQKQAEWYVRDVLISLANGFTRVSPGILFDTANAYYNGLWGGSGLMQRGPLGYPKKSYVAYATLTNVLDQVTLRRQVSTGSATVYALEFDRSDGKIVTALWASRGQVDFVLRFTADTPVEIIDMYGRSEHRQTAEGLAAIRAGTAACYVVSDKPLAEIAITGRTFPLDKARADLATVAASLDSAGAVVIDADNSLDTPQVAPLQLPIRLASAMTVRHVEDEDRGACIELALDAPTGDEISKYITEYVVVRLKEPAPVKSRPAALGVWVKGNSNWGRIMFEIEDAGGEVWRSVGTGGWGCDILDWPGNIAVNFDGWNFVAMPLRETTLFHDHSPGPVLEQWVSGGGDKRIDYPVKVTALIVEMHRTPLELTEFKPVPPAIRLRDISGIDE